MSIPTEAIRVTPGRENFVRLSRGPAAIPICKIPVGELDPPTVFERIREGKDSVLLESVKGTARVGRYSLVASRPFRVFESKNHDIRIREGLYETKLDGNPFSELRRLVEETPVAQIDGVPFFSGGAVGMIGYDAVHFFERLPRTAKDDLEIPDLYFLFLDTLVVFDHVDGDLFLVHVPMLRARPPDPKAQVEAYERGESKLKALLQRILDPAKPESSPPPRAAASFSVSANMEKEDYMRMVKRAKEYIRAGDIFQANLSQRLSADVGEMNAFELYRILRRINPSPFAAFMDLEGFQIVSSSPERLMRLEKGMVETRPIAGTRPRGKNARGDRAMSVELITNEKERAEHIMLIDLERNDIGRVCDYGSVRVDELMVLEEYSHVIHIVSNVSGKLHEKKNLFDLIRATFPGGTITGVPKVRCMEIIDELEPVQRGPYTGSIGYLGFNGDMDLNIIIRTFVIKDGKAHVQVGAGIVADSDPEREYYETLHKAEGLLQTLKVMQNLPNSERPVLPEDG